MTLVQEKRNYAEAMGLLLELYYIAKKYPSKLFHEDDNVLLFFRLFILAIPNFAPSIYLRQLNSFAYRILPGASGIFDADYLFLNDAENFLSLMMALETDVHNKTLLGDSFDFMYEGLFKRMASKSVSYAKKFKKIKDGANHVHDFICLSHRDPDLIPLLKTDEKSNPKETQHNQISLNETLSEAIYRIGRTIKHSDFSGSVEYYENINWRENKDSALARKIAVLTNNKGEIYAPGYDEPLVDLKDVVIYILVKYYYLHGSFNRIKTCKNCEKLFYEKKYGFGIFCNNKCRLTQHIAKESDVIRQCRDKQNSLLRRIWDAPSYEIIKKDDDRKGRPDTKDYVNKEDCLICKKPEKSGDCAALNRKNPELHKKILQRSSKKK